MERKQGEELLDKRGNQGRNLAQPTELFWWGTKQYGFKSTISLSDKLNDVLLLAQVFNIAD